MQNNLVLIVVNSVYQLFTAVHMRRSLLADRLVDLLVTDVTSVLNETIPRLQETGLFERVISGTTKELNKKYALLQQTYSMKVFKILIGRCVGI